MKIINRKLKSTFGFTLSETLITVLILLMVASIMAGGIPAAANAYTKAVDAANAQALLSTTVNALRSELSTAWDVTAAGSTITYYSSKTGSQSVISIADDSVEGIDPGTIMVQEYNDRTENKPDPHPLISDAASLKDDNLSVTYGTAAPSGTNVIKISGITVSKGEDNTIASMPELQIQFVKPVEEES